MLLFVGLGNPGAKYAGNRHNIGFMAVDAIARAYAFGPWKKKFRGEVCEGSINGVRTLLMKPQTFYNDSGHAVAEAARFYKIAQNEIVVFYDEIDLAPGRFRMKTFGC
jgi:PTH1 family peptidyl-tRNA hydrolase